MYRLPGERRPISIVEGPFGGASAEVETIPSWPLQTTAARLAAAFYAADGPAAEVRALSELYEFFVAEAQPTWALADHRGAIPASVDGMWRLPLDVAMEFVAQWIQPPASVVDDVVPAGPVQAELKQRLREARAAED